MLKAPETFSVTNKTHMGLPFSFGRADIQEHRFLRSFVARSFVPSSIEDHASDFNAHPTTIYERSADHKVQDIHSRIPRAVDPETSRNVTVSNPSAALQAKAATEGAFSNLLLGLGGVALLVGGVGVANTMIISVLERRHEIGLRRSIGATRGQIRTQFVTESLLLSTLGGAAGILLGSAATAIYALSSDIPWGIPPWTIGGGFTATLAIGTLAGLYPAIRAARVSPTLALHAA